MKITVKKEVVSESIEVSPGIYYFEDENMTYYKITLSEEDEEGVTQCRLEYTKSFANIFGITVEDREIYYDDDVPYYFKQFYLGLAGKKLEKEDFEEEKREILERLAKQ